VLVAQQMEKAHVGLDYRTDRFVVVRVEVLCLDAPQDLVQLVHVQLKDCRFGWHENTSNRRQRELPPPQEIAPELET
jgi:hypothetical protein